MAWIAVTCPQCSAPLPRVALWRSVKCGACGSLITRTESTVERAAFRRALARARENTGTAGHTIRCEGGEYQLLRLLGTGEGSEVHLARRTGIHSHLATLKLSFSPSASARHEKEASILRQIVGPLSGAASLYASRSFPEVLAFGKVDGEDSRHALVLRHPHGHWGSLATLAETFPSGIDPRHSVWIWRRILDTLHFIHSLGWSHANLRPEHALVHPRDHAIRLIGWDSARNHLGGKEKVRDLQRSARIILALAGEAPSIPPPLAALVDKAAFDDDFCETEGARGLDARLRAAARQAFGPASFVHLHL